MDTSRPATSVGLARLVALLAVTGLLLAATAVQAAATPTPQCAPNVTDTDRFCVTADTGIPDRNAGDPFSFDLTVQDTSPKDDPSTGLLFSQKNWVQRLSLELISTDLADARIVNSDRLPDGLIIAGTPAGCDAGEDGSFSSCTAGHGTLLADIQGTVFFDGIHEITFGVQRIVNVNDPEDGKWAKYVITVTACLPLVSPCTFQLTTTFPITGTRGVGDLVPTLSATVFRRFTQVIPNCPSPGSTCTVIADVSPELLGVHFPGTADTLATGEPADKTYTPLVLPKQCGSAEGAVTLTSHGTEPTDRRSVTIDVTKRVVNCPTASFQRSIDTREVSFDGSGSVPKVTDRTIAQYQWSFGDGDERTTAVPAVQHTYEQGHDVTASLVVVDSKGAISRSASTNLLGTDLTLDEHTTAERDVASGALTPALSDEQVSVSLFKKKADDTFALVETHLVPLSDAATYRTGFDRPNADRCKLVAEFAGDDATSHIGSTATLTFDC
jgi:hypothetical protein